MATNKPLVSIIIPVYNTENYLGKCVESILTQTYTNLEIILVDDGSSDQSPVICDDLSRKYVQIKSFHKENGGASDARNYGLSMANGKYIMYLDSDDYWCNETGLEKIIEIFMANEKKIDFMIFNNCDFFQSDIDIKKRPLFPTFITEGIDKYAKFGGFADIGRFPVSTRTKFFKKVFLTDNNIHFIKGHVGEDIPWFIEIVNKCVDFKVINEYFVYYRKQVQGAVTSSFSYKKYEDLMFIVENCIYKIHTKQYEEKLIKSIYVFMAYQYAILIAKLANVDNSKLDYYISWLKKYKWLLKYDNNRKVFLTRLAVTCIGFRLTSYILRFYVRKFIYRND